jgi:hypothetical protein
VKLFDTVDELVFFTESPRFSEVLMTGSTVSINSVLVIADHVLYSQIVSPPSEFFAFEVIS